MCHIAPAETHETQFLDEDKKRVLHKYVTLRNHDTTCELLCPRRIWLRMLCHSLGMTLKKHVRVEDALFVCIQELAAVCRGRGRHRR